MIPVICGSEGGAMVPVRSVYVGGYVCIDVMVSLYTWEWFYKHLGVCVCVEEGKLIILCIRPRHFQLLI